jgi:hypothetical protein
VTGPVTALGIRDGDPAVLRALIARRGSAVLAYCERACAPAQVPIAAADAFARFRALVVAAPRPADLDPEAALLSSTRHAAAARAPRGQAPPGGAGLGRLLSGRPTADQITLVPDLLIARADGTLDAEGEEQLNRLLDASASARAAEERFRAAEHAYRSAPPRPLPEDLVVQIVEAMRAVPAETPALATAGGVPAERPPAPIAETPPARDAPGAAVAQPSSQEMPRVARQEEPGVPDRPEAAHVAGEEEPAVNEEPDVGEPTREWDVPPEDIGDRAAMDVEIAAARLRDPADDEDRAAAHLQTASGAVDEPLVEEASDAAEPATDAVDDTARGVVDEPLIEEPPGGVDDGLAEEPPGDVDEGLSEEPPGGVPGGVEEPLADDVPDEVDEPLDEEPLVEEAPRPLVRPQDRRARGATPPPPKGGAARPGLPGKGALAPAAAVVAVAAVSILATSGVFGGNESQPAVDTGVAPKATQVEVPEGEAAAVIEDLRRAATDARRQRLADKRGSAPPPPAEEPAEEPAATPPPEDTGQEDTPAPPAPEGGGDEETPQEAPADDAAQEPQGEEEQDAGGTAAEGTTP